MLLMFVFVCFALLCRHISQAVQGLPLAKNGSMRGNGRSKQDKANFCPGFALFDFDDPLPANTEFSGQGFLVGPPRLHPDMAQERMRHLAKQGLHDIEPGPVSGRKHVFEPVGFAGQERAGLLGDTCRVIVQHQPDRTIGRIVTVQIF